MQLDSSLFFSQGWVSLQHSPRRPKGADEQITSLHRNRFKQVELTLGRHSVPETDWKETAAMHACISPTPTLRPPFTCKPWKGSWPPEGEVTSGDTIHVDARSLAGRDHSLTLPGASPADPFQLALHDAAQLRQR